MSRDRFDRVAAHLLTGTVLTALSCLNVLVPNGAVAQIDNQFLPSSAPIKITPSQNDATYTPDPYYSPEVQLDAPLDLNAAQDSVSQWTPPNSSQQQRASKPTPPARSVNRVKSLMEEEMWEPPMTPVAPGYNPSQLSHSPIPWLQHSAPQATTKPSPAFASTPPASDTFGNNSPSNSIIRPNTISPVASSTSQMVSNSFAGSSAKANVKNLEPAPSQTLAPTLTIPRPVAAVSTKAASSAKTFAAQGSASRNDKKFDTGSDFAVQMPKAKSAATTIKAKPAPIAERKVATKVTQPVRSKSKTQSLAASKTSNSSAGSSRSSVGSSTKSDGSSTKTQDTRHGRPQGAEAFEPTQLLALVGGEPIFVGDALLQVNQLIEQHMAAAPEEAKARERRNLIKAILPKLVNEKMMYVGAIQGLPEEVDIEQVVASAAKEFDEKALPDLLKRVKVKDAADYDALLRRMGSSLRKRRDAWARDQLTRYFVSEQLNLNGEITHPATAGRVPSQRGKVHDCRKSEVGTDHGPLRSI